MSSEGLRSHEDWVAGLSSGEAELRALKQIRAVVSSPAEVDSYRVGEILVGTIKDLQAPERARSVPDEKQILSVGEYYALAEHLGTVVLRNEEPDYKSEKGRDRMWKRTLVNPNNLDAAIQKVLVKYNEKIEATAEVDATFPPLPAHQLFLLALIHRDIMHGILPVRRTKLRDKYQEIYPDEFEGEDLTEEQIDLLLKGVFDWVFSSPR